MKPRYVTQYVYVISTYKMKKTPWEHAFEGKHGSGSDIYCLEYEKKELLALGYSFKRFIKDSAIKYVGMEVAKSTVLHAFFGKYWDTMCKV